MTSPDTNLPNLTGPLPSSAGQNPPTGALPLPLPAVTAPAPGSDGLQSIINTLTNNPAPAPPGPQVTLSTTGPTMKIDIDTVNTVIVGWNDVLNKVQLASRAGDYLSKIKNPGNDSASHDFANQANPVGDSHQQANLDLQQAIRAHISKLTIAVQQYQATDHGNAGNFNRQDK